MNRHYIEVAERAGHRCEYCQAPEVIFNLPFEVEHIHPASLGGYDHDLNLALACRSCNLFKANRIDFQDTVTGETIPLFNPRIQDWNDHFEMDFESGEIIAKTKTGRVTVLGLRMNRETSINARLMWIRLGLMKR